MSSVVNQKLKMMGFVKITGVLLSLKVVLSNKVSEEELKANKGQFCYRDCKINETRVCYYDWYLEHYHVLGP